MQRAVSVSSTNLESSIIISKEGLAVGPEKVKAIMNWPIPKDV